MLAPTVENRPNAYGVANVRASGVLPWVQNHVRWLARNFWQMKTQGDPGYTHPPGSPLDTVAYMLPHRVSSYRKPAFWAPVSNHKRQEYLVSPPNLPGTAIQYTLFHPTYIPGLQGYLDVLPWNFGWAWGKNNFEKFGSVAYLAKHPTQKQNAWNPAMKVPQGPGTGKVWAQPRPYYIPPIINPGRAR